MGLLAQLFRHKDDSREDSSAPPIARAGEIRDVGAIAAAAGLRAEPGMPVMFEVSLGDLLQRAPAKFVRPGKHDATLLLRLPAAEVAPGLGRGRAEISLSRLMAMAPAVFHREKGESDDPKVRLPIQKLLQQIGALSSAPSPVREFPAEQHPMPSVGDSEAIRETVASSPGREANNPEVALPPQAVAAAHLAIQAAPSEPVVRNLELRPAKDRPVSSTLRAVVLRGSAPGTSADAPVLAGHILAPRAPALTAAASQDAAPSILPAAAGARPAPDFAGLQSLFMSSVPLELADVAELTASLPGVHACLIRGVAGSAEAGEMPPGLNVEEVRAASEEFARKIGGVESTTIHRGEMAIAIFTRGGICLSAVSDSAGFVPGVRERLLKVTALLAGGDPAHQ